MSLADKLEYTIEAKQNICDACAEKGAEISSTTPFGEYGNYIKALPTGGSGEDYPRLYTPVINLQGGKNLSIRDKDLNGIFSQKAIIKLNYEDYAEIDMDDGFAAYAFEEGALQIGDELYILVTAPNFQNSNPVVKLLDSSDFVYYGDGTYNLVLKGYDNRIMINGVAISAGTSPSYFTGNISTHNNWFDAFTSVDHGYTSFFTPLFGNSTSNWGTSQTSADGKVYEYWDHIYSGTYTYNSVTCMATDNKITCSFCFHGGANTPYLIIGDIKFDVDNLGYKTIKELVDEEIITPLVLMWSGSSGGYYFNNLFNIYDGGRTNQGNFSIGYLFFVLKRGHTINNMSMYASNATGSNYADGLLFSAINHDYFGLSYKQE